MHEGEDDITLVTQDSVLATFERILGAITLALTAISAVSLLVAGILTMNVMLVTVAQRRSEIGLLKALGARQHEIRRLFLLEALLLSLTGAGAGTLVGYLISTLVGLRYPSFPIAVPWWGTLSAVFISLLSGVVFGVIPARRAAQLEPVHALSSRY